jgi:hypothetical protein
MVTRKADLATNLTKHPHSYHGMDEGPSLAITGLSVRTVRSSGATEIQGQVAAFVVQVRKVDRRGIWELVLDESALAPRAAAGSSAIT